MAETLGIIAIIFGSGGLLQGLIAPASLFLTRSQMNAFVEQGADQGEIDSYLAQLSSLTYLNAAAFVVLGAILLAGGILLLKKRRVSSPLLQSWAFVKMLAGGFFLFKTSALTRLQMSIIMEPTFIKAGAGAGGAELQTIGQITTYAVWIGLAFGFLWLAALPVFLIIWFNRSRIKDEMAGW